ncbi:MAG: hypothetical protein IKP86_00920 [Anaerolineaceae bacterium]|nr:hypothetical protein [Anaerolineaceae bacterium]
MTRRKRIFAVWLCLVFMLVMLASSALIVHGAGHCCTGVHCPVCQMISANSQLMRFLGAAVLVSAFFFSVSADRLPWRDAFRIPVPSSGTLVSLNIRLND